VERELPQHAVPGQGDVHVAAGAPCRHHGRGLSTGSFSGSIGFDPFNTSDFEGLIRTIDAAPNRASFYTALDATATARSRRMNSRRA
jgi:hypothetical protein